MTVAVLLGCPTGRLEAPRPLALARVRTAALLLRTGVASRVLVVGGAPRGGCSEAQVMAELLEREGVPPSCIECEHLSANTLENALAARRLLTGERHVLVVTQRFHAARARRCFALAGLSAVVCEAPAPVDARRRRVLRMRERLSWWLLPLHRLVQLLRR